ncbi:MAG TPA: Hsp20/alpha crystallin family protein [Candidatus Bipolaricaulota bacterium]|nr:Hsp20/alpha crystallin family protein [Candidatus Bipolaricaulota bacterium]
MPLIKWSPFMEPFGDFDKIFDDMKRGAIAGFLPAIDMYEKGNNVIVEAQLPGIDPDKLDISVENDILTIKGKTEKKSEVEEKNYYRKEIHAGGFYRSLALPAHVQGDKAAAEFEDGVLKVVIPKEKAPSAKKVKVIAKNKNGKKA